MLGVSDSKGEVIIRYSGIVYFLLIFILKEHKLPLSILITGATIVAMSLYFMIRKKEQAVFFGIPTWILGVVALGFGAFTLIS